MNGDFSNGAAGWSQPSSGSASVSNGAIRVTGSGGSWPLATQNVTVVIGKKYALSGYLVNSSGISNAALSAGGGIDILGKSLPGSYSLDFFATTSNLVVGSGANGILANGAWVEWDNISVREILGYSNTYSGFVAGNYFDSAGTTHASVDGSVGLVLDAAGSVGAELFVSPQTIPNNNVGQVINFGSFKTVRVTGSGIVGCNVFDKSSNTWVSLTNRHIYTDVINIYNTSGGAVTINPGDVSFKEVTGIHASQVTPGYKPTLRKGIVNLLLNSHDLVTGSWGKNDATAIVGQPDPFGGLSAQALVDNSTFNFHQVVRSHTLSVGMNYTSAFLIKANGRSFAFCGLYDGVSDHAAYFNLANGGVGTAVSTSGTSSVSLGNGWWLCVVNLTASGTAGLQALGASPADGVRQYSGNGASGLLFCGSGIFAGTLTAAQILAAGGIPLTTTAPASSQAGPLHAEFLGDDYLTMGSLPITSGSDFAIVAAANCTTGTGRSVIFAQRASTSANPIALELGFLNGAPSVRVRNDAGVALTLTHGSTLVNKKCCIGARATGSTIELWVDGVMSQSATIPGTPIFTNVATIGCGSNGAGGYADYFIGSIYTLLPVKGTLTDADMVTEFKFAAGIQL